MQLPLREQRSTDNDNDNDNDTQTKHFHLAGLRFRIRSQSPSSTPPVQTPYPAQQGTRGASRGGGVRTVPAHAALRICREKQAWGRGNGFL